MDELTVNVYDDRQRERIDDIVSSRVRSLWFKNYEANLPLIKKWGGLEKIPLLEKAVVVGAGWTLWDGAYAQRWHDDKWHTLKVKGNLALLQDIPCPVIACDKIAAKAAQYCKPTMVTALNTQATEVGDWLRSFRKVMQEKWGEGSHKGVQLVVPVTVHPDTLDNWEGSVAFTNPSNTCSELFTTVEAETGLPPTVRGDNVGYFSVIVAMSLGAREVAIIGMPYAYQTREKAMEATKGRHCIEIYDELLRGYVYTTFDWIDSRREFVNFVQEMRGQNVCRTVNCTEGGILYQAAAISPLPFAEWKKYLGAQA